MKVPFFDFALVPENLLLDWKDAFASVVSEGHFIQGTTVRDFEKKWASLTGSNFAIGVGNGFDGLAVALRALGLNPGDRVAVPAHTFIACWFAIHSVGGVPVGVDVDSKGLMDLEILESLEPKPKYVMPVHMHGAMVDMPRLMHWANLCNVMVIEDASQAHLASLNGKYSGTWGHIGVFSLYPTKNLGALGDAGIVITDNAEVAERVRSLTNYGSTKNIKYQHASFGINSRLDSLQAAFLLRALPNLIQWNRHRKSLSTQYELALSDVVGIAPLHNEQNNQVWHHYAIVTSQRDALRKFLTEKGVGTDIHYPFCAAEEYQNIFGGNEIFPQALLISRNILSLPISQWHSKEQIAYVAESIIEYFKLSNESSNE